jgi:hypothetical protein
MIPDRNFSSQHMHPVVVLFDDASKRICVRLPYVCARTRKFGENQKNSNSGGESSVMNNGVAGDVSAADDSGRDTPSCMDNAMPIKEMATCKDDKKGQDKGVGNYSVQEHVNLLRIMSNNPSSFNASESSPEWREVYVEMCKSHYTHWGSTPRLSSTLHAHVVEMYGALKKGMRHLSLTPGAPKCLHLIWKQMMLN